MADVAKIEKKIHPRILQTRSILRHKLNLVDSFAVYVRAAVAFARWNFSLFQGQNATVIRVYCKWIHPLLLMGCTIILSCSDCSKGFHQQTARQLKTMQWRSIQITVFTRAWQNLMRSEHALLSCNLEREYCLHVNKLWGAISSYYIQTAANSVAWENSGHCGMPLLVCPSEKQLYCQDLDNTSVGWSKFPTWNNQSEALPRSG